MGILKRIRELENKVKELQNDIDELEHLVLVNGRMEHMLLERIRVHEEFTQSVEDAWQKECDVKFEKLKEKKEKNQ